MASPGVYRHYKGPLYEVLAPLAHDADIEGRYVVVYIGLQLDSAKDGPRVAVRTSSTFEELVHRDGTPCIHQVDSECTFGGGRRPRFEYLGPAFQVSMIQQAVPL